ncbi:MAG: hypothetical protein ACE5H4_15035 [Candidatus Thorarchaeota archaeon]
MDDFGEVIDLSEPEEEPLNQLSKIHPIRVPEYYLTLINEKDSEDSIRRMAIPTNSELIAGGVYDTSVNNRVAKGGIKSRMVNGVCLAIDQDTDEPIDEIVRLKKLVRGIISSSIRSTRH